MLRHLVSCRGLWSRTRALVKPQPVSLRRLSTLSRSSPALPLPARSTCLWPRTLSTASSAPLTGASLPSVPQFNNPREMHEHIAEVTSTTDADCIRNYVGVIKDMSRDALVVETDLFPRDALAFYTRHNLAQTSRDDDGGDDAALYEQYYSASRGGGQGDYRAGIAAKVDNVIECLREFPGSKRAVLTVPFAERTSSEADHRDTDEAKCLREVHFYVQDGRVCATGIMRAQASVIFPKNIHFIGTVMNDVADALGLPTGFYHHHVTTLTNER